MFQCTVLAAIHYWTVASLRERIRVVWYSTVRHSVPNLI
nr:MAG TPA: hypothetical protein [Caudoviricetes sp.]